MMPAHASHPRSPSPPLPHALAPSAQLSLLPSSMLPVLPVLPVLLPSSMLPVLLFSLLAMLPSEAEAMAAAVAGNCGQLIHHDQGGDYTNADDRQGLAVVEQFHFTSGVERLVRGVSDTLGGDIGYTLEHFPNHHRALAAMARLALRDKTSTPQGARYSVECYFDRALRQKQDDPKVHALFGGYLLALGQADAALEQLQSAAQLAPADATAHYNLGLLYLRKKDYAHARASAQQAYALGFPLPGLKNKLVAAGQWQDP